MIHKIRSKKKKKEAITEVQEKRHFKKKHQNQSRKTTPTKQNNNQQPTPLEYNACAHRLIPLSFLLFASRRYDSTESWFELCGSVLCYHPITIPIP